MIIRCDDKHSIATGVSLTGTTVTKFATSFHRLSDMEQGVCAESDPHRAPHKPNFPAAITLSSNACGIGSRVS